MGLTSFQNEGYITFLGGVGIQARDSISTGRMTVLSGEVNLFAKTINVEALATDGKEGAVKLTADNISSKQLIALSREVIFSVKERAVLNGTHSAGIFGFKGGEVVHTGLLIVSNKIKFFDLQTFTHTSGEMKAFVIKGRVDHFENNGLMNAKTHLGIGGNEFNNNSIVHSADISLFFDRVNNPGNILASHKDIKEDGVQANLSSVTKISDLGGAFFRQDKHLEVRQKMGLVI